MPPKLHTVTNTPDDARRTFQQVERYLIKHDSRLLDLEGGRGMKSLKFDDLEDVNLADIADGQVVSYVADEMEYQPLTLTLSGLTDTTLTSPADSDLLAYDLTSGQWINQTAAEAGLAAALHAPTHTNGTDDIQDATAAQKGLMTDTYATKLDGIEALADVTDSDNVDLAGAVMESDYTAAGIVLAGIGVGTPSGVQLTTGSVLGIGTGGGFPTNLSGSGLRLVCGASGAYWHANKVNGADVDNTGAATGDVLILDLTGSPTLAYGDVSAIGGNLDGRYYTESEIDAFFAALQLSDLADVGDTTNTTGNVLMADGVDSWDSVALNAQYVTYTPLVLTDWDGDADPGDVNDALDQLAERVDDVEGNKAPINSTYIVVNADASLTKERSLAAGEGIDLTDGGENSTITVSGEDATAANKGIATFNTANFAVLDGDVTIKDQGVAYDEIQNVSTSDVFLGRDTAGAGVIEEIGAAAARTILNVEDGADVTDSTNVDSAGAVMETDFTVANSILTADSISTPGALEITTYSFVGRGSTGIIQPISVAANRLVGRTATSGLTDLGKTDFTEESEPAALDFVIGYLADGSLARYDVDNWILADGTVALATDWDAGAYGITADQLLVGDADDTTTPDEYVGVGTDTDGMLFSTGGIVYLDGRLSNTADVQIRINDGGTRKTLIELDADTAMLTLGYNTESDLIIGVDAQSSVTEVRPSVNAKVDLGSDTYEFNDGWFDGTVQTDALAIHTGGTESVGAGAGSVLMSTGNPANSAAWIPITYNGTGYFVPAWTAHDP